MKENVLYTCGCYWLENIAGVSMQSFAHSPLTGQNHTFKANSCTNMQTVFRTRESCCDRSMLNTAPRRLLRQLNKPLSEPLIRSTLCRTDSVLLLCSFSLGFALSIDTSTICFFKRTCLYVDMFIEFPLPLHPSTLTSMIYLDNEHVCLWTCPNHLSFLLVANFKKLYISPFYPSILDGTSQFAHDMEFVEVSCVPSFRMPIFFSRGTCQCPCL